MNRPLIEMIATESLESWKDRVTDTLGSVLCSVKNLGAHGGCLNLDTSDPQIAEDRRNWIIEILHPLVKIWDPTKDFTYEVNELATESGDDSIVHYSVNILFNRV